MQRYFEYAMYLTIIIFIAGAYITIFQEALLGEGVTIHTQSTGSVDINSGVVDLNVGTLTEAQQSIIAGTAPEQTPAWIKGLMQIPGIGEAARGLLGIFQLINFLIISGTAYHAVLNRALPPLLGDSVGKQMSNLIFGIVTIIQFVGLTYLLLSLASIIRGGGRA